MGLAGRGILVARSGGFICNNREPVRKNATFATVVGMGVSSNQGRNWKKNIVLCDLPRPKTVSSKWVPSSMLFCPL